MIISTKRIFSLGAFILCFCLLSVMLQAQNERADIALPSNQEQPVLSQPVMATVVIPGEFTNASPTQTGRLNRNGIGSSCIAPKICDIFLTDPGRAFSTHTFVNPEPNPLCVDLTLDVFCPMANVQMNAYLDSFDPNNICTNYLGDPGFSSGVPASQVMYSVEIPVGQTLVMVVHTTNPGEVCLALDGGYEITISGDFTVGPPPPPIPTMGEWGIIILGMSFAIIGIVAVRRRVFSLN